MKKIINGKVYDTDKATELGYYSNGGSWRDFQHYEETLYRKKTGEYFLFGEGGPMTRYAERVELNSWGSGSRIMPLTYQEATAWAEKHLDADEYESIFGDVEEDETKIVTTMRLSASTVELLKRRAAAEGKGIAELADALLSETLKRECPTDGEAK